jgi:hypothetical protein
MIRSGTIELARSSVEIGIITFTALRKGRQTCNITDYSSKKQRHVAYVYEHVICNDWKRRDGHLNVNTHCTSYLVTKRNVICDFIIISSHFQCEKGLQIWELYTEQRVRTCKFRERITVESSIICLERGLNA